MSRCEEIAVRLYQYIDRELTEEEYQQVREHLDACPPCKHVFQLEQNVLSLVRDRCRRVCAPPNLIDRIRRLSAEEIQ